MGRRTNNMLVRSTKKGIDFSLPPPPMAFTMRRRGQERNKSPHQAVRGQVVNQPWGDAKTEGIRIKQSWRNISFKLDVNSLEPWAGNGMSWSLTEGHTFSLHRPLRVMYTPHVKYLKCYSFLAKGDLYDVVHSSKKKEKQWPKRGRGGWYKFSFLPAECNSLETSLRAFDLENTLSTGSILAADPYVSSSNTRARSNGSRPFLVCSSKGENVGRA